MKPRDYLVSVEKESHLTNAFGDTFCLPEDPRQSLSNGDWHETVPSELLGMSSLTWRRPARVVSYSSLTQEKMLPTPQPRAKSVNVPRNVRKSPSSISDVNVTNLATIANPGTRQAANMCGWKVDLVSTYRRGASFLNLTNLWRRDAETKSKVETCRPSGVKTSPERQADIERVLCRHGQRCNQHQHG